MPSLSQVVDSTRFPREYQYLNPERVRSSNILQSDILAYKSACHLAKLNNSSDAQIESSETFYNFKGGVSGGTIASFKALTEADPYRVKRGMGEFALVTTEGKFFPTVISEALLMLVRVSFPRRIFHRSPTLLQQLPDSRTRRILRYGPCEHRHRPPFVGSVPITAAACVGI